jgi:hypothetical protein
VAHAVLSFEFSCSRLRDLNAGASLTDRTGVGYIKKKFINFFFFLKKKTHN